MPGLALNDGRLDLLADFHALGAPCVERTALRRVHGARNVALEHGFGGVLLIDGKARNGSKKGIGVGVPKRLLIISFVLKK